MKLTTSGANTSDWLKAIGGRTILSYIEPYYIVQKFVPIEMGEYQKAFDQSIGEEPVFRIKDRFDVLASEWRKESLVLSSVQEISDLSSYRDIIDMGYKVISFILEELLKQPDHWFYALRVITDEDPVPAEDIGNMNKMADDWINWGRESALID